MAHWHGHRTQQTSTIRLPQSLRETLDASAPNDDDRNFVKSGRRGQQLSRKEARRLARQETKLHKAQHFSRTRHHADAPAFGSVDEARPQKKGRQAADVDPAEDQEPERTPKGKEKSLEKVTGAMKQARRLEHPQVPAPNPRRSQAEDKEDAYIAMLESKLGLAKKSKGKSKYGGAFEDDGLLDILTGIDTFESSLAKDEAPGGDNMHVSDKENSEIMSDSDEEGHTYEEWHGIQSEPSSSRTATPTPATEEEDTATISSQTHYVPPQLRANSSTISDTTVHRKLKGLLNRLSEQNMASILQEIENLYRNHRRHDITESLTTLIVDGICSHAILLDSYVDLHAALVACLYKMVGTEVAAHVVYGVVSAFESHYGKVTDSNADASDENPNGKECSNLLVLLTSLYTFDVISCVLMYDIVRLILDGTIREIDVELLLKIVQHAGARLRQDDPSALGDIVQIIQKKVSDQSGTTPNSRTRFMLETLSNLKSNKTKRTASQASAIEATERIRKVVTSVTKRYHSQAHEALRVTLSDLRTADTKGKWWFVGAAWGGDPLVDRQVVQSTTEEPSSLKSENALLKLARKQGMNTDVRRSIFVVLMSSDDYVDACDRLSQLNLTEIQQREIMRVLLHCCGNEKAYNPYYTLVGQHLCRSSHSHKITLQFCLWDFLRSLGETSVGGPEMQVRGDEEAVPEFSNSNTSSKTAIRIANLARMYAWWIAKDAVQLTVLKSIDFTVAKPQTCDFLKQFFPNFFLSTQLSSPAFLPTNAEGTIVERDRVPLEEVTQKCLRLPALAHGMLYFLSTQLKDVPQIQTDFMSWALDVTKDILRLA